MTNLVAHQTTKSGMVLVALDAAIPCVRMRTAEGAEKVSPCVFLGSWERIGDAMRAALRFELFKDFEDRLAHFGDL